MKLVSRKAEQGLLCACCDRKRILQYALCNMHEDLFGSSPALEVFKRILDYVSKGKGVPSTLMMANDPGLSPEAQTFLKISRELRAKIASFSKRDVVACIDVLDYYRKVRVAYEHAKWLAEQLDGNRRIDFKQLSAKTQESLVDLEDVDQMGESHQLGVDGNMSDEHIAKQFLDEEGQTIKTGIHAIDSQVGGLRTGNLLTLSGKQGQGKSALLKSLMLSMFYENKVSTVIYNLEMADWEYWLRLFSESADISHGKLRYPRTRKTRLKLTQKVIEQKNAIEKFGKKHGCRFRIRTVNDPSFTVMDLMNEIQYQGFSVVGIDYINLLNASRAAKVDDIWKSIYIISKFLKGMAKRTKTLVIPLSQMNDDDTTKYGRALQEDSDYWWLWRLREGSSKMLMLQRKARHYKPFPFPMIFDGDKMRVINPESISTKEAEKIEERARKNWEEQIKLAKKYGEDPEATNRRRA